MYGKKESLRKVFLNVDLGVEMLLIYIGLLGVYFWGLFGFLLIVKVVVIIILIYKGKKYLILICKKIWYLFFLNFKFYINGKILLYSSIFIYILK